MNTADFSANPGLKISCAKEINIGNDVLMGWNVLIIDSDGHDVIHNGEIVNFPKPVSIHDHVWLCAETKILKGGIIENGSVVGMGSIVTKPILGSNVLIKDNNVLRTDTTWKH